MARATYKDWIEKDKLILLEAWARDGLTDKQIAKNIGIAESTLYNWKNDHVEILESLKKGKEVIDIEVENALLKRALGYEYEEVKTYIEENNGVIKKRKEITKKIMAPDTTAQIFWLKNRKADNWRDRKETNMTGNIETNPFKSLTTEELKKLATDDD